MYIWLRLDVKINFVDELFLKTQFTTKREVTACVGIMLGRPVQLGTVCLLGDLT